MSEMTTKVTAPKINPNDVLNALEGALEMLNAIANGQTYDAKDYFDALLKIELALARGRR